MAFGQTHGPEDTILPDRVVDVLRGCDKEQEEGNEEGDACDDADEDVKDLGDTIEGFDDVLLDQHVSRLILEIIPDAISDEVSLLCRDIRI